MFQEEENRYKGNLLIHYPRVQSEQVGKALRFGHRRSWPKETAMLGHRLGPQHVLNEQSLIDLVKTGSRQQQTSL